MDAPPKTLVKSRANLQAMSAYTLELTKYEAFDIVLAYVWTRIRPLLQGTGVTEYCINLYDLERHTSRLVSAQYSNHYSMEYITELMEVLRRDYPGVTFTYRETTGYEGNVLERIILMDWS